MAVVEEDDNAVLGWPGEHAPRGTEIAKDNSDLPIALVADPEHALIVGYIDRRLPQPGSFEATIWRRRRAPFARAMPLRRNQFIVESYGSRCKTQKDDRCEQASTQGVCAPTKDSRSSIEARSGFVRDERDGSSESDNRSYGQQCCCAAIASGNVKRIRIGGTDRVQLPSKGQTIRGRNDEESRQNPALRRDSNAPGHGRYGGHRGQSSIHYTAWLILDGSTVPPSRNAGPSDRSPATRCLEVCCSPLAGNAAGVYYGAELVMLKMSIRRR